MSKSSYTTDLLKAAKLAAVNDNDSLLIYLIEMAIERASTISAQAVRQTA